MSKDCGKLCITRFDSQAVWIGDDIKVTVLIPKHSKRNVKLIIEAPKDINIAREELK